MAETYNGLEEKFKVAQQETVSSATNNSNSFNYDELKMYFGEDYWVTDDICIKVPKIGEILEYGDSKFYSVVSTLCANPTSFRLQLWQKNIDWNELSEFELFAILVKSFTPQDTYLLFGDLNLSWFEFIYSEEKECHVLIYLKRDENDNILPIDINHTIIIDEFIYIQIVNYIRNMFNIHPKVEHAKNKATKKAMIWEDEMNLQAQQNKEKNEGKSFLLPLVSAMVNHPGFKYKTDELKEVNIVQFMDSVKRLQTYENVTALLKGMYSGFIDSSHIKNSDINWLKDLNE